MDDAIKTDKAGITDVTKILLPEQMEWLKTQVAAGQYSSIEEGIRTAVALAKLQIDSLADEDMDWVKPYLEEAEADIKAGKCIPAEEVFARLEKKFE